MFRRLSFLVLPLLAASPCWAEEKPAVTVAVVLHDRTTIQRATLPEPIEFAMKAGKLKVAPTDVRRLDFGRHVSAATAAQIERLIAGLDDADFKVREAAQVELIALGAASHPVLKARLRGAGLDLTGRLNDALKQIEEQVPADQLALPTDDRLVTTDSALTGRVGGEEIKLRTAFGELSVKLSLIRSIQVVHEAVLEASAEKCAVGPDSWLETDFQIDADTGVLLTATGKVTLNNGAAEFTSEPEGQAMQNGYGQIGLLMGRIGPDGAVFPIGKQTAIHTGLHGGKLYLHINPTGVGGVAGGYKVRAATGSCGLVEQRIPDPSAAMLLALRQEIAALREQLLLGQKLQEMIRPREDRPRPLGKTDLPRTIGIN